MVERQISDKPCRRVEGAHRGADCRPKRVFAVKSTMVSYEPDSGVGAKTLECDSFVVVHFTLWNWRTN
jgi:hypothetical protein